MLINVHWEEEKFEVVIFRQSLTLYSNFIFNLFNEILHKKINAQIKSLLLIF